ncbi:MAG: bifunctional folylpolyglutamate synthase/dihydrofolate synthase [Clostridiales bacterium]|nr:bifunctional folylpolyglutamate synthase/dihydrofolate synthase [Clostridiales bacterium]
MNEREAMEWIEERGKMGSVYGLDSIRKLLDALGNPQENLRFVHIAGTNGKGSVSAYISTILKCAGYRVGRYISPTIFTYRERIQVGERPITKKRLCDLLTQIRNVTEMLEKNGEPGPTAFEIETAMAFLYFVEKECDVVVLETGLGGRMDATNVIRNTMAAVFASISMDHMAVLGNTLEKIAKQKAGIIKKGCRVISMRQQEDAERVLQEEAEKAGCPFVSADVSEAADIRYGLKKQRFSYGGYRNLEIALAGTWQIENAVLAVRVMEELKNPGFPVSEKQLRKGLLMTEWPGRLTVIGEKPYFIVDGAHNEDASAKLADSLRFYFTNKRIIYIMGILRDKEYEKIIRNTAELAEQIITVTPPDNPRAMHAYELAQEVRRFHPSVTAVDSLAEAVEMSRLLADKDSVIVAFGSLSYLGRLIQLVKSKDSRGDSHGRSGKN